MPNRALLMGVSEYDADVIANLDFVSNDLNTLGRALVNVGYDITTLGGAGDRSPTHNSILTGVYDFCRNEVQQDEVAIIYFSGHGLHYQGRDYLVPADATLGDELIEQVMVPVDFGAVYEQSPASAIMFFVDACREGIDLGEKSSLGYQQWSQGKLENVRRQQSAYVFACGPGEVSRFIPGEEGFSLFTRALSETLEARPEIALTFGRVRKELQQRVNGLADDYQKKRQSIRVITEGGVDQSDLAALQLAPVGIRKGSAAAGQPSIDIDALSEFEISDEDLRLLSYKLNGSEPWLEGTVPIVHVLRCSAGLSLSIRAVVERLQEFKPLGLRLPPVNLETYGDLILERSDLVVLPASTEDRLAGRTSEVSAVHVLYAANKLAVSVDAVWKRLEQFEPLGIKMPKVDMTPLSGVMVDGRDLTMLSAQLTGLPPWVQGEVSVIHVMRASNRLKEPIGSVLERLGQLETCGIRLPDGIKPSARDWVVSDKDIDFLSEDMDGVAPWVTSPMPVGHVLCAAKEEGITVGQVITRLQRFKEIGIELPEIDEKETADLRVDPRDVEAISQDFDGVSPWLEKEIPGVRLVATAQKDGESVKQVYERLKRYEITGLHLPDIDLTAVSQLFVNEDDLLLLFGDEDEEEWLSENIPVAHILFAANRLNLPLAEAWKRAARFQAVGMKLPQIDLEAVETLRIEDKDLVLLSQNLDGFAPWLGPEVDWFHLLRAAHRLDESVQDIVSRLHKFEVAGYRASHPQVVPLKDLKVSETDLLLLSRDLDGYPPWIGGHPVGIIHALRGSAKLEEPVGLIMEQLNRFESIGIELPPVDDQDSKKLQVVNEDLLILSQNLDGAAPWVGSRISIGHVLAAAYVRGESVGRTIERLRRFKGFGFVVPEIPDQAKMMRISEQDLVLLSEDLDARAPWVEGKVPVIHLLQAANRLEEQVGETFERLHKLESVNAVRFSPKLAEPSRSFQQRLRRSF